METIIQKNNYTFLKFIDFKNITLWDVKRYIINRNIYNNSFKTILLKTILKRKKNEIELDSNIEYKQVTIKLYGKGVVLRDIKKGSDIKTKKQFSVNSGDFIYSKIDARNGAFGIVPKELDNSIITSSFSNYEINKKLVYPDFLTLITTSNSFQTVCEKQSSGTTGRRNISDEILENIEIPLPNLTTQEQLLQNYYTKIQLAESQEKQADELEKGVDEYLFRELGVDIIEEKPTKFQLSFISFSKLKRWGVAFINNSNTADKLLISKKYPNEPLAKYVEINPQTSFAKLEVSEMSFLPMECVSDDFGEVKEYYEGKKENSNGYTKFIEDDLLWSKITPCMQNGKSAIVENLKNGFGYGSTEYHVLRKKSNQIDMEFVYHILRTKYIRKQGVYHFTGSAGQQRVPAEFLKELYVPFPPVKIQQEISEQIKTWKTQIKTLREQSKANKANAIKEFEKEIFEL